MSPAIEAGPAPPPELPAHEAPVPATAPPAEKPPEGAQAPAGHSPWPWGAKVLTPIGFLGLLFLPIEVPILLLNSYVLALGLSLVFGQQPQPWFTIAVGTYYRDVSLFDVTGLVLTLCDLLAGAVVLQKWFTQGDERTRIPPVVCLVAGIVLALLFAVEVGTGAWAGYLTHGPAGAVLRALIAAAILGAGILMGFFGHPRLPGAVEPLPGAAAGVVHRPGGLLSNGTYEEAFHVQSDGSIWGQSSDGAPG